MTKFEKMKEMIKNWAYHTLRRPSRRFYSSISGQELARESSERLAQEYIAKIEGKSFTKRVERGSFAREQSSMANIYWFPLLPSGVKVFVLTSMSFLKDLISVRRFNFFVKLFHSQLFQVQLILQLIVNYTLPLLL